MMVALPIKKRVGLFIGGLLLLGGVLPPVARAADTDITADHLVRDKEGVVTATGKVEIKRADETLTADRVRYDSAHHHVKAQGHVVVESPQARIEAKSAEMDTVTKQGVLHHATVYFPDGKSITGERIDRLDELHYLAHKMVYTACPMDQKVWDIRASSSTLDQKEGVLTARNARFEFGGVPILYTPYWRQATRRKSGVLLPFFATGKRRGTEWALPLYLAPSPDWDATITPHLMTARGLMGELELRHVSTVGSETIQAEGIHDKKIGRTRSRIKGKTSWNLPHGMHLNVDADHLSDHDYLADFSHDAQAVSTPYVYSRGALSWAGEYGGWELSAQHQQNLTSATNDATLQILPRFESNLAVPVFDRFATVHFDQQTTRFDRRTGVDGWRTYLHPYVEVPFTLAGGGVNAVVHAGGEQTRYWLKKNSPNNRLFRSSGEFSAQISSVFEHVSDSHLLRHTIEPTLRYDVVNVTDQSKLPNFDSGFSGLSMSSLMSGNRYTGHDLVESTNRISLLLGSRLQSKGDLKASAETLVLAHVGVAYDLRRRNSVTGQPTYATPLSNLVGDISLQPLSGLSLSASGQYDSKNRFFDTGHANMNWSSGDGRELQVSYLYTDARYSTEAQLLRGSAKVRVSSYWHVLGSWDYDLLLKRSSQFSWGVDYIHPCWSLKIEAYKIIRPTGTSAVADTGVRFLIGFEGVGSVGGNG